MDTVTLWRAALLQLVAVALLSLVLALALPHDFFVDWGWAVGPLAWLGCAALTARLLALPLNPTLAGALLAGLPSVAAVVLDAHWAGAVLAVALFGALVRLAARACGPRRALGGDPNRAQHSNSPSADRGTIEIAPWRGNPPGSGPKSR